MQVTAFKNALPLIQVAQIVGATPSAPVSAFWQDTTVSPAVSFKRYQLSNVPLQVVNGVYSVSGNGYTVVDGAVVPIHVVMSIDTAAKVMSVIAIRLSDNVILAAETVTGCTTSVLA